MTSWQPVTLYSLVPTQTEHVDWDDPDSERRRPFGSCARRPHVHDAFWDIAGARDRRSPWTSREDRVSAAGVGEHVPLSCRRARQCQGFLCLRWTGKGVYCSNWSSLVIRVGCCTSTQNRDILTSDDLLVGFNCTVWYVIFWALQNIDFEWRTAMTRRF